MFLVSEILFVVVITEKEDRSLVDTVQEVECVPSSQAQIEDIG